MAEYDIWEKENLENANYMVTTSDKRKKFKIGVSTD